MRTQTRILAKRQKDSIFRFKTLYLLGQKGVFLGVKDTIFRFKSLYLLVQKTVSFTPETLYLLDEITVSFKPKDSIFLTDSVKFPNGLRRIK